MNDYKVGIFTPLYGRPDFARVVAMQFAFQTRKPDYVAFYQNGNFASYEWSIVDLNLPYEYNWIHKLGIETNQSNWYGVPLKDLLDNNCDFYCWCDQDDIYYSNHIEDSVNDLLNNNADIVINEFAGLLKVNKRNFSFANIRFKAHDPGGVSSSMVFNRQFAEELYKDLMVNCETSEHFWADNVVSKVTMPKFSVYRNNTKMSVTYLCHSGAASSAAWINDLPEA